MRFRCHSSLSRICCWESSAKMPPSSDAITRDCEKWVTISSGKARGVVSRTRLTLVRLGSGFLTCGSRMNSETTLIRVAAYVGPHPECAPPNDIFIVQEVQTQDSTTARWLPEMGEGTRFCKPASWVRECRRLFSSMARLVQGPSTWLALLRFVAVRTPRHMHRDIMGAVTQVREAWSCAAPYYAWVVGEKHQG